MNARHWNISTVDSPPFGMTKYEDELATHLEHLGVTVEQVRRKSGAVLGNTVSSWFTRYRQGNSDLVHATFQTVAPAALLRDPDAFVVTVHDLAPLVYDEEITDVSTRLQWALTPRALGKANQIIAISEFTKRELVRLTEISTADVTVVHQGVDHDRYTPMEKSRCRDYFGLDPDTTYVLVVSSNKVHKRISQIPAILDAVRDERDNVKALKSGYGTGLEGDGIVSTGWVDEEDMPKLYNAADIYLHTSEYEGFGLPILEAMACGTPVVAKSVASIPEIVDDAFELSPREASPSDLARDIVERLESTGENETRQAVERSKHFSWEKTAKETKRVYEAVTDQ